MSLSTRRFHTRLAAAATITALSVSLVACGDSDDDDADDTRTDSSSETTDGSEGAEGTDGTDGAAGGTLTQEQVEAATLTIDNLGAGWTQDPADDTEDDDSEGPGCIGEIGKITQALEKVATAETGFSFGEQGLPQVNSKVSTYPDEAEVVAAFDEVEAGIENCPSINWESEGYTYDLTLTPTTDVAGITVDDQNGFVASGNLTTPDGQESPIFLHLNYLRVGPTVATVGVTALEDRSAEQEAYVKIGANRLGAVVAGEDPPAETGPSIS